jgi:hypothetical protein
MDPAEASVTGEVVGIVGNVRQYALDREPAPEIYLLPPKSLDETGDSRTRR